MAPVISVRFTEITVIAQVVMASQEGNTPSEGRSVKVEKGPDPVGVGEWYEVLSHSSTVIVDPTLRPCVRDHKSDLPPGVIQWL